MSGGTVDDGIGLYLDVLRIERGLSVNSVGGHRLQPAKNPRANVVFQPPSSKLAANNAPTA